MGCDIHAFVEVKDKREDKWRAAKVFTADSDFETFSLANPPYTRDYELFGWLTGGVVRCHSNNGLGEPKGTPFDMSWGVRGEWDKWEDCAHSASYATIAEMNKLRKKMPKKDDDEYIFEDATPLRKRVKRFVDDCRTIAQMDERFFGDDDDVRVVFWFDS